RPIAPGRPTGLVTQVRFPLRASRTSGDGSGKAECEALDSVSAGRFHRGRGGGRGWVAVDLATKWENKVLFRAEVTRLGDLEAKLAQGVISYTLIRKGPDKFGADGWGLAAIAYPPSEAIYHLKRPWKPRSRPNHPLRQTAAASLVP